jgi:hypothetical protein
MEQLLSFLPCLLSTALTTLIIAIFRYLTVRTLAQRPDIKSTRPSIYGYGFEKYDTPVGQGTLPPLKELAGKRKQPPKKGKKRSRAPAQILE